MAFFRYPGGKKKIKTQIIKALEAQINHTQIEYREPFFGGGSIGLELLSNPAVVKFHINDFDPGIASLWTTVIHHHEALCEKIEQYKPEVEHFEKYKKELLALASVPLDLAAIVDIGFKKIAIHQISYSGLGTKSGGPLGGKTQTSIYKIDCRWSPLYLVKKIKAIHERLKKVGAYCTHQDFLPVISLPSSLPVLLYLDPPYYVQGLALYQCGFNHQDHVRLATALKECPHAWVLSYDDCPQIRELYGWASIEVISSVNYSINAKKVGIERQSTKKDELLISNRKVTTWMFVAD